VLAFPLRIFPDRCDLWRRAADLEKAHSTHKSLDKLLAPDVECCPQAEVLWLMWAKEKWLGGDVRAPLAAVNLRAENGEFPVARELLVHVRTVVDSERVLQPFFFSRREARPPRKARGVDVLRSSGNVRLTHS
jgi:pre-mRNA-processing factor 6